MDKIKDLTHISGSGCDPHFTFQIKEPGRHGRKLFFCISERDGAKLATDLLRNLQVVAKPKR